MIFADNPLPALLLCSCLASALAQDPPNDPDLPQPLSLDFADSLLTGSPFSRMVNLEDTLQLTGLAWVDGRPVATVCNTTTKERYVISETPNALGWHVTAAVTGADPSQTTVELQIGPETVTMHYGGALLSPGATGNKRPASSLAGSKGGDKLKPSTLLGENGKQLYASLSPEGRDKFKDLIRSQLEKRPELSPEQTAAYARKAFARLKAEDPGAGGKISKPTKTTKKKQGA